MKRKEFEKIKSRPATELAKDINEKREKLAVLTKDLYSGKLKNVREARAVRKDIARMLTLIAAKQNSNK